MYIIRSTSQHLTIRKTFLIADTFVTRHFSIQPLDLERNDRANSQIDDDAKRRARMRREGGSFLSLAVSERRIRGALHVRERANETTLYTPRNNVHQQVNRVWACMHVSLFFLHSTIFTRDNITKTRSKTRRLPPGVILYGHCSVIMNFYRFSKISFFLLKK